MSKEMFLNYKSSKSVLFPNCTGGKIAICKDPRYVAAAESFH